MASIGNRAEVVLQNNKTKNDVRIKSSIKGYSIDVGVIRLISFEIKYIVGITIKTFEIEYWSSLDSKYIILEIEAESETDAVKQFKSMHPHKKYRLLEPLDD